MSYDIIALMVDATKVPKLVDESQLPPLYPGDHLTRAEFEQRYNAYPDLKKAELIEGVVYIPTPASASPISIQHGQIHATTSTWLGAYRANTRGLHLTVNPTVRFDVKTEVQPDAVLYIEPERGGKIILKEGYLSGAPELVVEVATSSAAYDLHEKLRIYRRNGVQEYLVLLVYEQRTHWFQLVDSQYEPMSPGEDGVLRSQIFPGLHFHPALFWGDDLAGLLQVLQQGLATPEHQAFVNQTESGRN